MRRWLIGMGLVLLGGCVSQEHVDLDAKQRLDRFIRTNIAQPVRSWGAPASVVSIQNSQRLFTWQRIYLTAPDGHKVLAQVTFTVDANGNIVRWDDKVFFHQPEIDGAN